MPDSPIGNRRLGDQGLVVSAQGLGCMGMSQSYGPADEDESIATLHRALELGVTFWDTANVYGDGHNELLLSRVLADHRDEVVLATKFAMSRDDQGRFHVDGTPENVRRCAEESLQRLGVDHIDLYYQHRVDRRVPIEDTIGAMAELVAEGKVRYLGMSEASSRSLERANAVHPISALQSEWSLFTRDLEADVVGTARRLGIGLVPYSPLGRGFLTGAIADVSTLSADDSRLANERFKGENFDRNMALVQRIRALAEQKDATPGQIALAWVSAQGDDVVPIPGTKRRKYLEENVAALGVTLTRDDLATLEDIAPVGAAAGARYAGTNPAFGAYGDSPERTAG